jgi:glycosyltransferase involved in cell wall biosynthesis
MGNNINVLHLRSSGALLGAENVILEIAKNSKRFGYNSIVGAIKDCRDPVPDFLEVAKKKYRLQTLLLENRKILDLNCASALRKYIVQNNIKLLHCHGYKEDYFGLLSRVSIPKIATNHLWKNTTFKLRVYGLIDALFLHFFDRVVGVSDELVQKMKKLGINNVYKIANGVDVDRFTIVSKSSLMLDRFNLDPDAIVLGMVSSLTPEKNHKIVFDVLANIRDPKVKLLIVGDGPQDAFLRTKVTEMNLQETVIFAGRQENIQEILSIVDIYLLPSVAEGSPMSLLEAMACGKAVVASRVGGNENVITHKENGLLVEPGNLSDLIHCIEFLLRERSLIREYGIKARRTVENNFSSNVMTGNYCQVYSELLDNEQKAKGL